MELRGWLMEMFDLATLPNVYPNGEALTDEYIRGMVQYLREDNAYPTDGIVFKLNQKNAIIHAGEATAHHPKDAVAFKFNPQGVETTLRDVIWQVGRTGVLTPVAVFDTVKIGGTNVSRATLSNVANAASFHIGDTVEVVKAGEIIPYIRKVRGCDNTVSVVPLTCPCCGSTLSSSDLNIFCTNPLCRDKVAAKLEYACGKNALDIDGMGLVFSRMIADKLLAGENDVEPPQKLLTSTTRSCFSCPARWTISSTESQEPKGTEDSLKSWRNGSTMQHYPNGLLQWRFPMSVAPVRKVSPMLTPISTLSSLSSPKI